jgi:hypothetical protein
MGSLVSTSTEYPSNVQNRPAQDRSSISDDYFSDTISSYAPTHEISIHPLVIGDVYDGEDYPPMPSPSTQTLDQLGWRIGPGTLPSFAEPDRNE